MERLNTCGCDVAPCEGQHDQGPCGNCEECCNCFDVALLAMIDMARSGVQGVTWTDVVRFMADADYDAYAIACIWRGQNLPGQVFYNYTRGLGACSVGCLNNDFFRSGLVVAEYVEDLPEHNRGWFCDCGDYLDPNYQPTDGDCSTCYNHCYYEDIDAQLCEDCVNARDYPECNCGDSHAVGDGTACATTADVLPPEFWTHISRLNTPCQLVIWTEDEIVGVDQLILI